VGNARGTAAGRRIGASVLGALLVLLAVGGPASASHDDHGPGTVLLRTGVDGRDRVTVVFPEDADDDAAIAEVERVADAAGLTLRDVEAVFNDDPDTVRVRADVALVERTGALGRRLPAERAAVWQEVEGVEVVLLQTGRWERGSDVVDGETALDGTSDVRFSLSPWLVGIPVALVVLLGPLAYAVTRWHGRRVAAVDGPVADRLHRVRRTVVAVQLGAAALVLGVLLATGTSDGLAAGLSILLGRALPTSISVITGFAGYLVPVLAVVVGSTAGVIPVDRELRGTDQSTREGASDAARMMVVMFLPIAVWLVLVAWAPGGEGWAAVVRLLVFLPAVVILGPLVVNLAMRTRPLEGEVRQRILDRLDERGLRVRDVRLIDSRGGKVANAAISGVIPQLRYVYVSDHLLEIAEDDELDAILEHEIAHGEGHHVLLKTVAAFAALLVGGGLLVALLLTVLRDAGSGVLIATLAVGMPLVMVTALLVVQGVVSVRLEYRADERAAERVGADAMRRGLERVAEANQLKRRTGGIWNLLQQHPGVEQRLERLARLDDGAVDEHADVEAAR
jgi:Zn-dependent protease with chaperone function